MNKHLSLVLGKHHYEDEAKVVYAYYKGDNADSAVDKGTVLRFVEPLVTNQPNFCIVPGLIPVDATFDDSCLAAYCDHWVSNGTMTQLSGNHVVRLPHSKESRL